MVELGWGRLNNNSRSTCIIITLLFLRLHLKDLVHLMVRWGDSVYCLIKGCVKSFTYSRTVQYTYRWSSDSYSNCIMGSELNIAIDSFFAVAYVMSTGHVNMSHC